MHCPFLPDCKIVNASVSGDIVRCACQTHGPGFTFTAGSDAADAVRQSAGLEAAEGFVTVDDDVEEEIDLDEE